MGELVSLADYRKRNPDKVAKLESYERLRGLERDLFGEAEKGESFLELILEGADVPTFNEDDIPPEAGPISEVSRFMLATDIASKGYMNMNRYNLGQYRDFLYQSLMHYHVFEPKQRVLDRLSGVAEQIMRHEQGLPMIYDQDGISQARSTPLGRISYWFKERKVRKEIYNFKQSAMEEAMTICQRMDDERKKKQETTSSHGYSSGPSSLGSS